MGQAFDVATGITIVFGTSGFSAQILDITPPAPSRDAIDSSHQGTTTSKTFSPADLRDNGELSFDIHFNPATTVPMSAAETITVTWPDSDTWSFTGFVTSYEARAMLNDKMTATVTVKVSGNITQA